MRINPKILEGVVAVKQDSMERAMHAKSCAGSSDFNYNQFPNLEKRRVNLELIRLVRDTSKLLSSVTKKETDECSGKIPRLDSCRVATYGECNTACGSGFGFTDSYIPYDTVKHSAEFILPHDFMHCNELGEPEFVKDEIMAMMLTNIQNEMELQFIYGDQNIPTGPGHPDLNNMLALNDGILKLASVSAPETQIIDAMGAGPSPELFMAARTALPPRYRRERDQYVFLVGPEIKDWYTRFLSYRPTETADAALRTGELARIWGNELYEVPMWREDFAFGTAPDTIDTTHILYIKLENPLYISRRRAIFQSDYKLECDHTLYKAYWEQDAILQRPEELVLIKNVAPCGEPWTGCGTTNYDCFEAGTIPNPVQCD